ncbi:MAG: hypothetical protein NT136_00185 [Candidatus Moranbacteria bacterium]|nr:hypothetical protein [Candidatus Moranbacteria bacterium]
METRYLIQIMITFLVGATVVGFSAITGIWHPNNPWVFASAMAIGGFVGFIVIPIF